MKIDAIEDLLKEKIGLDVKSLGNNGISSHVKKRMEITGLHDSGKYFELLLKSKNEMEHLTDLVVVPETWFFRDIGPYVYLRKYYRTEWLPANPGKIIRILSAPCSTGEEPYSIAVSLLEEGVFSGGFLIDAIDICKNSLEKAKAGIFKKNSFRKPAGEIQRKYFKQTKAGLGILPEIKQRIRFSCENIIDRSFAEAKQQYHVIFCKNLLIYLDRERKKIVLETMKNLLAPGGILFAGHAESLQIFSGDFKYINSSMAFAYRIKSHNNKKIQEIHKRKNIEDGNKRQIKQIKSKIKKQEKIRFVQKTKSIKKESDVDNSSPAAEEKVLLLKKANKMANLGKNKEAVKYCEKFLREHGPNAEAYYLLGLIQESEGNDDIAEEYYNKSVYLNPEYFDALIHLSLLLENKNPEKSNLFRQRAGRISK